MNESEANADPRSSQLLSDEPDPGNHRTVQGVTLW